MASYIHPTILFVHGSWHTPNHFTRVRQIFKNKGFPTSCPLQPSVGKLPPIGLKEDAQCIRDELTKLIDKEHKDVIVVAHSYGGVITTEAVDADFAKKLRESKGLSGGVLRLVFMCAFLLPPENSLASTFGGQLPPFIDIDEKGMSSMQEPERRFYNDLPKDEQKHWTSELKLSPALAQMTPISQVAYMYHPVTYLFCENDEALPLEVQQQMVQGVSQNAGIVVDTASCTAGHSPFLSQPETVLKLVEGLIVS